MKLFNMPAFKKNKDNSKSFEYNFNNNNKKLTKKLENLKD